jgi:hypothetical protein
VVGCCEYGDEHVGSIKSGISQEQLRWMEYSAVAFYANLK